MCAATVLVVVGGVAATPSAHAATPSCGSSCLELFSHLYGTHAHPGFVLGVPEEHSPLGTAVALDPSGNADPGEDYKVSFQGQVADFVTAGLMDPGLDALYSTLNVFEFQFSPYGVDSGLCLGVGSVPGDGTPVTLQPCGVTARTTWIVDTEGSQPVGDYVSLINGATASDFADPPVLSELQPGLPLFTFASTSVGGVIVADQQWGADFGVLRAGAGGIVAPTPPTAAGAPVTATVYVPDLIDGTVTPVDGGSRTAGPAIASGGFADAAAFTPDGQTAYVTNGVTGTVTPIDVATNTAGPAIHTNGWAYAVAVTPDGKTAYVVDFDSGTVTPIDVATNVVGTPITVGAGPTAIAITPDGKTAYVTDSTDGTVTPIDVATNTAGSPIPVGQGPDAVAITPDGRTAYVTNSSDGTVTPIDVATNTARTPIAVGQGPDAVAITPDASTAYVTNSSDGTVTPIDVATSTAGPSIPVGDYPDAVAITPDGTTAWVSNLFDDTVAPITLATNTPGTPVAVGSGPAGVAVTGPMQIGNNPGLPPGTTGSPYTQQLWSVAGTSPISYAVTSGALPAGLTLSDGGLISGTPTTAQSGSFTVTATDSSTDQRIATKAFTLSIAQGPPVVTTPAPPVVTPPAPPVVTTPAPPVLPTPSPAPAPRTARCPAATGTVSRTTLGPLTLGVTRTTAEHRYPVHSGRGRRYEDFFCLTPRAIRVGYASPKLLRTLRPAARSRFRDRVVWISTTNTRYAIDGVRVGDRIARARRELKRGTLFVVGRNDWYLAPDRAATAMLKVRHGVVKEVGLASKALTRTRAQERIFVRTFY